MKSIILLSFFLVISSKTKYDFGAEIPFDKDQKQFSFTAEQSGKIFIYFRYEGSSLVEALMQGDETKRLSKFSKPGVSRIYDISKGYTYSLTITVPNDDEKGFVWLNPSWNEIKVDLNKMYQFKFDYIDDFDTEPKLIYSIDNADKNVTFKFDYNKNIKKKTIPNPFQVCHGEDCLDNIETYDIIPGESYKIYVKAFKEEGSSTYYFPSFKFGDVKGDWSFSFNLRANLWIISLLLLLI